MYGFIRGTVLTKYSVSKELTALIIFPYGDQNKTSSVNKNYQASKSSGLGYTVLTSFKLASQFKVHQQIELWLHTLSTDKELVLYGFISLKQYQLFLKLIAISGVGPKVALAILGFYQVEDIIRIITEKDSQALRSVPGLGAKGAAKIIVELSNDDDVLQGLDINQGQKRMDFALGAEFRPYLSEIGELKEVLQALGYQVKEINRLINKQAKALLSALKKGNSTEELLKVVLKK